MTARHSAAALSAAAVVSLALPLTASASPDRAEELNEEGRELFQQEDYTAAIERFERAIEIHSDPRYHFNLCFTFYMRGDLYDALDACDAVQPPRADDDLLEKRDQVLGWVDEEFDEMEEGKEEPAGSEEWPPADGGAPQDDEVGGEHANGGPPEGQEGPPGEHGAGPPPEDAGEGEQVAYRPDSESARERRQRRMDRQGELRHDYNWSIGLAGGALGTVGMGGDRFQSGGVQLGVLGDFILSSEGRVGGQLYGNFGLKGPADDSPASEESLMLYNVGGAFFQHLPLLESVYLTPLVGVHVGFLQPDRRDDSFILAGARAEASLDYVFGSEDEHTLSLTPIGVTLYSPPADWTGDNSPGHYGLDGASSSYTFSIGYKMRFSDAFDRTVGLQ